MIFYGLTDKGKLRIQNQDCVFFSDAPVGLLPDVFIVCDGMGGHNAGEYASGFAIQKFLERLRERRESDAVRALSDAIDYANSAIFEEALSDPEKNGMGTTLVCATIDGAHMTVANVGDSRLYVVGDNSIRQITRDHSVVGELVRRGALTEEAAEYHRDRHKITRAVGAEETVRTDFFDVELHEGEIVLLCTDGLTNEVTDEEILETVSGGSSLKEKAHALTDAANAHRGADNITVLLIEPFKNAD